MYGQALFQKVIKKLFWRLEIELLLSTLFDTIIICCIFILHNKNFGLEFLIKKGKPSQLQTESPGNNNNEVVSDNDLDNSAEIDDENR